MGGVVWLENWQSKVMLYPNKYMWHFWKPKKENFGKLYIHLKFRHACHESRDWQNVDFLVFIIIKFNI